MAPVLGSKDVFCSMTAIGPGLTVPVNALPSHLSSTTTGLRCVGVGPQSPLHVPLTAFAFWAIKGGVRQASTQIRNAALNLICPLMKFQVLKREQVTTGNRKSTL